MGAYSAQGLATAVLEEGIKQMELEDACRLVKQETQAHMERKLLDHQAKEGQEEALRANKWGLIFPKAGRKRLTLV